MRAHELNEYVSPQQMSEIDNFADALWGKLGIDVNFTRHFFDRVNDERNGKEITTAEMVRLFRKEYEKFGKAVAGMENYDEAVFTDLVTNINLPFVMRGEGDNKTLVAKTVMRKPDFKTNTPSFPVK